MTTHSHPTPGPNAAPARPEAPVAIPSPESGSSSNARSAGLAVVALIVAVVAIVLSRQSGVPAARGDAGLANELASAAAALSGRRSELGYLPDDSLLGFVEIPSGPFLMGGDNASDPLAFDNERWSPASAQATVEVPTFYIGRTEVTSAEYRVFVAETGRHADASALGQPLDHPVAWVSWPDALAYARWLEQKLKDSPQTPPAIADLLNQGWHVSLPTEAEWEKAARGTDGRRYPWGNEPRRDLANYGGQGTRPVGSVPCPECAFGLSDMAGNVWEWTLSPYQPYPFEPGDDRDTLGTDALWVMRGGGFSDTEQNVRATTRGGADPGARRPFLGFRVVIARR